MPRSSLLRSYVATIALVTAACQSKGGGGTPAPTPAPGADAAAVEPGPPLRGPRAQVLEIDPRTLPEPTVVLPRQDSFKLLEPGAAPRVVRRYALRTTGEVRLVTDLAITSRTMLDAAWSDRLELPRIREGFGVTASRAASGGKLLLRGLPAEIDIKATTPAPAQAAARELNRRWQALLEGRRATAAVDDRGQLSGVVIADEQPGPAGQPDKPSEASIDLTQRLLGAAVPLPVEAIGVGARWRVVTMLRMGAAVVKQTAEYTLVAVDGDRWTIKVNIRRLGERQLVDAPGLPPGVIPELVALFRELTGEVTVTAAQPLPVAGTLATELRVHSRVHDPAQGDRESFTEDIGAVTLSAAMPTPTPAPPAPPTPTPAPPTPTPATP